MKTLTFEAPSWDPDVAREAAEAAIISLHGFPGVRSRQNVEIAERVSVRTGRTAHVLLYSGLGRAEGHFTFEGCVGEVRAFFSGLFSSPRRKADLIGHSFGGYLSLLMANEFPDRIRRIVLMSPLLKFFPEDVCHPFFADVHRNHPHLSLDAPEALSRDFLDIGTKFPPGDLVRSLPESIEILFLQAREDLITPVSIAEEMIPLFKRRPDFQVVEQDHSFLLNREELSLKIGTFLA